MLNDEIIHEIIKKYFQKRNVLTDHQISSYNDLIDNILPTLLNQLFPLQVNVNTDISFTLSRPLQLVSFFNFYVCKCFPV